MYSVRMAAWLAGTILLFAVAAEAEDAPAIQCSISLPQAALKVGDEFVVAVSFRNVSGKPLTVYQPTWYAGTELDIRNDKGEPVRMMMAKVERRWSDPKAFYHPLQAGESYATEIRGRIGYNRLARGEAPAEGDREAFVNFDDASCSLGRAGKFTATLRHVIDAKAAEEGRKLGFEGAWVGHVASNTVEFSVRPATADDLKANAAAIRAGAEDARREAVRFAGAACNREAVRALMDVMADGASPLHTDAGSALGMIQDLSVLGELKEIFARSVKGLAANDPAEWATSVFYTIWNLEPDRAKFLDFAADVVRSDAPAAARIAAVGTFHGTNDDKALAALLEEAKRPDGPVQWSALATLGFTASRLEGAAKSRVTTALVEVMKKNPDAEARRRAINALQFASDVTVVPALLDALKDPDPGIGIYASFALGALAGPEALGPLQSWAEGKPATTRDCALRAIDSIRKRGGPKTE